MWHCCGSCAHYSHHNNNSETKGKNRQKNKVRPSSTHSENESALVVLIIKGGKVRNNTIWGSGRPFLPAFFWSISAADPQRHNNKPSSLITFCSIFKSRVWRCLPEAHYQTTWQGEREGPYLPSLLTPLHPHITRKTINNTT